MYSGSVEDKATHFCNFDCHYTTPPANVIMYPEVDFLVSTSPAISASVYPHNRGLSSLKRKQILEVPLRYLRIHLTACQCSLPRLERNLVTTPTAWAISGLVHTIVYIKLLTADAYDTFFISCLSFSLVGHCLELNLKCPASGVLTVLNCPC